MEPLLPPPAVLLPRMKFFRSKSAEPLELRPSGEERTLLFPPPKLGDPRGEVRGDCEAELLFPLLVGLGD